MTGGGWVVVALHVYSFEYIVDQKLAIAIPFDQLNYYIKFAHTDRTERDREIIMRLARMDVGEEWGL